MVFEYTERWHFSVYEKWGVKQRHFRRAILSLIIRDKGNCDQGWRGRVFISLEFSIEVDKWGQSTGVKDGLAVQLINWEIAGDNIPWEFGIKVESD